MVDNGMHFLGYKRQFLHEQGDQGIAYYLPNPRELHSVKEQFIFH